MARSLIIFDFDGTLADTWRDIFTALNETLREEGLAPASGAQVRHWIGSGVAKLIERALPEAQRDQQRIDALVARFRKHYERTCLDTTTLYDGIPECLARLANHSLAVLSNKPTRFLERIIDGLGLSGRFAAVVGADATLKPKPDPAAIEQVVRMVGNRLDRVWMIGDSEIDMATGRLAGARTIGCAWGLRGVAELRAAGADFLIDHPREIPPIVDRESATPRGG